MPDFSGTTIMALSDDFREQLKAGNITQALALALSEAVELKITTWVASAEDNEVDEAKPGHRLRTRINLIEGDIENEIGDQFLNNGRYRELREFHLEQVAEGNKIIHNNLKSLQKLFEALVVLRYPEQASPSIKSDSSVENDLLLPTDAVTDTGVLIEPPDSFIEDSLVIPHTVTNEEITATDVVIELPEAVVEESVFPHPLTEETISTDLQIERPPPLVVEDSAFIADIPTEESDSDEAPPLPIEELSSLPTTSGDSTTELESETDDDDDNWDDSVLDLLESLPISPLPDEQASSLEVDEDWESFVEQDLETESADLDSEDETTWATFTLDDLELPPTSAVPSLEAPDEEIDEDWGDLIEPEPEPTSSEVAATQEADVFSFDDYDSPPTSPAPNIEVLDSQTDEDWGDLVEPEPTPEPEKPIPSLDSLNLEEDEAWNEWVVEEPESTPDVSVMDINTLDLGEDEDWGDLEEDADPFAAPSTLNQLSPDLDINENWDEFSAQELEPYSANPDLDTDPIDALFEDDEPNVDKRVPPPPPEDRFGN